MIINRRRGILLALLFLVFIALNSSSVWKWMYPVHYKKEIKQVSEKLGVNPFLVLSIIHNESKFRTGSVSHKGAIGLMQLMPETAGWIIQEAGFSPVTIDYLDQPEVNILIGSWYLSFLQKKYNHNALMAIAAYNAGPGNVDYWLREKIWNGSYEQLNQIPYGETRHYIRRVLYFYGRFQSIYPEYFTN